MEGEKLSLERQQVSRIPADQMAISLKRAAISAAEQPFQKKARPALPPDPVRKPTNKRVFVPQVSTVQKPNPGSQGQGKYFRTPVQSNQAKVQQAKGRQSAQGNNTTSLATAATLNFKKPKLNTIPKPFAPPASSSGSNPGTSSASHKR